MSYELFYTSVHQGLRPGTKGFCTVGLTRGTPALLVDRLESLSGYRPLFPAGSPQANQNPVSWSHWRVTAGSQAYSVLSRVCFSGLDYTQRSNKFAHHVALTTAEQSTGGPAWLMAQPDMMVAQWSGEPAEYEQGPAIPDGDSFPAVCQAWADAAGDAGWAGVLAEAFVTNPAKPSFVIYPPGVDMLPLMVEALALIDDRERWQVTFNTYFTDLPAGLTCAWRCCISGSPAAQEARRAGGLVIDLTGRLAAAPDSEFVQVARTGAAAAAAVEDEVSFGQPTTESKERETEVLVAESQLDDRAAMAAAGGGAPGKPKVSLASLGGRGPLPLKGDTVNQRWMPPVAATIVESDENAVAPSVAGGLGLMFWLFAAAWPLLVGGVTFGVLRSRVGSESQIAPKSVQADLIKLQDRAETAEAQLKHFSEQADQVRREKEGLTADLEKAKEDIDKLRGDLARAAPTAMVAPPNSTTLPATQPDTGATTQPKVEVPVITLKPAAPLMKNIHGTSYQYVRLDEQDMGHGPQRTVLGKIGGAETACTLSLKVVDDTGACRAKLVSGSLVVCRPRGGSPGDIDLCTFALVDHELRLDWPSVKAEDDALRRSFLQTALLVVSNSEGFQTSIQFFEPEFKEVSITDSSAFELAPPPRDGLSRHLDLFGEEAPWMILEAAPVKSYFKFALIERNKTVFDLRFENGKLTSNWAEKMVSERQKLATLKSEYDTLVQNPPIDTNEKDKSAEHKKELLEKTHDHKKQCHAKLAELTKQRSIVIFKPITALVKLKSNAIVSCITVMTEDK